MLAQRLVGFREIVREKITGLGDHVGRAAFLSPGELEERAPKVPTRSGPFPPDEGVAIGAKPGVQLSLGDAEPPGSDGRVARERATKGRCDHGAGAIIEGIALGREETKGATCVAELPPRVIDVAIRAVGREPLHAGLGRLDE